VYSCSGRIDQAKVVNATRNGVNVLIWFAVDLVADPATGNPLIRPGQGLLHNYSCVAETQALLKRMTLPTVHMISVGGWNAPHPDTRFTGRQWFAAFDRWNHGLFDGVDWDLEGNDVPDSPWNKFSPATMSLVGEFSQAAKAAGYVMSLVPPQSYLDVSTDAFDLSLTHAYSNWHPEFKYHGRNAYALWLSKYGNTVLPAPTRAQHGAAGRHGTSSDDTVATFDFVSIQLYESWSAASYELTQAGVPMSTFLPTYVAALTKGWRVRFSAYTPAPAAPPLWNDSLVAVPPSQLVLGWSYGWQHGKGLFAWPEDIGHGYEAIAEAARPRGMMYWNIVQNEGPGAIGVNGTRTKVDFAAGFNRFLHTR
jgi:hypothetical protein